MAGSGLLSGVIRPGLSQGCLTVPDFLADRQGTSKAEKLIFGLF